MYEIVIGRSESDLKKFGLQGTIFLGKLYVQMGQTTSLSNKVYMDVSRSHIILVSGKRGCLTGNTKILTNNGSKQIKDINFLKDKIYSYNKKNKKFEWKLTRLLKYPIKNEELTKIELTNNQSLTLTEEHPLLVLENKKEVWKEANKIKKGDKIMILAKNNISTSKIKNISKIDNIKEVYDLVIPQTHNFIANGIISHNSGKSYSLGVIAEEMCNLPEEVSKRLAVVIIDTMGIFWTMKYPNEKDEDLLAEWGLPKKSLDINIYVPSGFYKKYKEQKIPADYEFTIKPSELNTGDWCNTFGIQLTDSIGILIERTIGKAKEIYQEDYSIDNIIKIIHEDPKIDEKTKLAAENRFAAAKEWGLFSSKGTPLKDIIKGGKATVIDISPYTNVSGNWSIKGLVVGLICRKLMSERMLARKISELEDVESGHSYFIYEKEEEKEEMPLVWILLDESHEMLPKEGSTPATDALIQILREGRQPGVSLILATQQPGEIHKDVITQTDIVLSHRITARKDIQALNDMMQTYLYGDIQKFLNSLPTDKGSAIILDDNSERMYPIKVRPRFTWHGGEAPVAVKAPGRALQELGL